MSGSVAERSSRERSLHAAGGKSELDTSVGKALALLEAFQDAGEPVGVTHLAAAAGLPKSTAYRLLGILLEWGLVERSGSGYCLGAHLFELGNAIPSCGPSGLREIASPHLMRLYEASHETVHLGVLDGTAVIYVERLCGRNAPAASRVGVRVPAESAALGKVILAFSSREVVTRVLARGLQRQSAYTIVEPQPFVEHLKAIRSAGIAFDREETFLGIACVAAPVLGRDGSALAAVSLAGPTHRFDPDAFAAQVRAVTSDITRGLQASR